MSIVSQGPGWWQGQDGKWYPPEPGSAAPPPSSPVSSAAATPAPGAGLPQATPDRVVSGSPGAPPAFCANCGAAGEPGFQFCSSCGAAVTPQAPVQPLTSPAAGSVPTTILGEAQIGGDPSAPAKKPSSNKKVFAGVVIVVLLALIGGGLYLLLGRSSTSSGPQAVADALVADLNDAKFTQACSLTIPSQRSICESATSTYYQELQTYQATGKFSVGTVTVHGDQATVRGTVKACNPGICSTTDLRWSIPMVKQGGKWYVLGVGRMLIGDAGANGFPGNSGSSGNSGNSGALGNSGAIRSSSPRSVGKAVVTDLNDGSDSQVCSLVLPSQQSACRRDVRSAASRFRQELSNNRETAKYSVSTVTVHGNQATAVLDEWVCGNGCTNPSNHISMIKQDGRWYVSGVKSLYGVAGLNKAAGSTGSTGTSGSSSNSGNTGSLGNSGSSGSTGSTGSTGNTP